MAGKPLPAVPGKPEELHRWVRSVRRGLNSSQEKFAARLGWSTSTAVRKERAPGKKGAQPVLPRDIEAIKKLWNQEARDV